MGEPINQNYSNYFDENSGNAQAIKHLKIKK